MTKSVEFFFDIVSPASYLAWTQMPKLAQETGAEIIYRPFFLPGVFEKATSSSPITVPNKSKWLFGDLKMWAEHYGVPFQMNSKFPFSSLPQMRGLIAYADDPRMVDLGDKFYAAMWADNLDLTDPAVMGEVVASAGIDPQEYMEKIADPQVKQQVFTITDEVVTRGGFGAPTFFVGDQMFWGQDRIDFVKRALQA